MSGDRNDGHQRKKHEETNKKEALGGKRLYITTLSPAVFK